MKNEVESRYLLKLDEVNKISEELIEYSVLEKDFKKAKKRFSDILLDAYIEGFAGAAYMLGEDVKADPIKAKKMTDHRYADSDKTVSEKFRGHFFNKETDLIKTLTESEWHRSYSTGAFDAAKKAKAKYKKWNVLGINTRDTHWSVDGQVIDIDELFIASDGDFALFPGDFAKVENNANCRCWLIFSR